MDEPVIEEGWIDTLVRAELPGLRLRWIDVPVVPGKPPPEVHARLALLSNRFRGAQAVRMRLDPIPHAYRVFFRAIGLDPDETRTPIEAVALERLRVGGFVASDRVEAALLVAVAETGVPLWALDGAALDGPLGVREARRGERLGTGEYADDIPPGHLVVADAEAPAAVLFGDLAPSHRTTRRTAAVRVFTLQVEGVPELHVEEALWACAEALDAG